MEYVLNAIEIKYLQIRFVSAGLILLELVEFVINADLGLFIIALPKYATVFAK